MSASFSFELLKLRKRVAVWVLAGVLVLFVAVFDYYQFYSAVGSLERGGTDPTNQISNVGEFRDYLLPGSVPVNVAGLLSFFGGPVALILGALAAGSEYGWGTFKTTLTQRPGRLGILSGKLLAVGLVLAAYAAIALAAGAASSYLVAGFWEETVSWPPVGDFVLALGVVWLVFAAWASVGIFLAMLFESTALAIGLGLVYGLVVENLIFGFSEQSRLIEALTKILLAKNGGDLANSLGNVPQAFASPDPTGSMQAALVLGVYVVGLLAIATLVFRRRDVV